MARILVVDGAASVRESVRMILAGLHAVAVAGAPEEAARATGGLAPDLVLAGGPAGRRRRAADGAAPWVEPVRRALPRTPVLSLPLPFAVSDLRGAVRRALAEGRGRRAGAGPGDADGWRDRLVEALLAAADDGALGRLAARAAGTTVPVLLVGERGSGRETLARWIHARGPLAPGPFVAVACAGLSPAAFAARLARLPAGGERPTLFLKGLDDASPALQRAVLDLLESGGVCEEQGARIEVGARTIASVSDAAFERAERGEVAAALLDALGIVTIEVPPLRDRPALIAAVAGPLLERAAGACGSPRARRLAPSALERLSLYCWPGNLRELANVLARSAALSDRETLEAEELEFAVSAGPWSFGGVNLRGSSEDTAGTREESAGTPDEGPQEGAILPGGADRASPDLRRLGPSAHDLTSLAGELAHELKNPLVAIKTFTHLLAERFDDGEFRREFYAVVRREVERIDHLVQGVLHAAGAVPQEPRPVDLNSLLDAVLVQSETWMVERRVVAFKELEEAPPAALADPALARAALFNVVARALASLPVGEDLFLATRARPTLSVVVRYEDAGPGPNEGGEELELALARAALERAGGRLHIERGPGRRTTVVLEFRPAEVRLTA